MTSLKNEIIEFSIDKISRAHSLLEKSKFRPFRYLNKELDSELTTFWTASILNNLNLTDSFGLGAEQDGKIVGLLTISCNPWESNVLGTNSAVINTFVVDNGIPNQLQIASAILDRAINQANTKGIEFIQCKSYTDDTTTIHALEKNGFLLTDTVVDCAYDYRRVPLEHIIRPIIEKAITIREANLDDHDQLVYVAGHSFNDHFGRFHSDEKIGRKLATKVYEQWICSSLDGYADKIHVAEIDQRIVGFSIWKFPTPLERNLKVRVGHYSIAGILPAFHKHGLFTALTYAGMESLEDFAEIIEGPTHINNYGVQRGYEKLHWRVLCDARHTFHKWLTTSKRFAPL